MKKKLTRIINVLLILLFCIGSVFFIITKYFSENIERSIISKIQQNMQTPLILNDVEFTLYENFPYASVKITDLLVLESEEFNGDTLIFAKLAYVNISLLNIIKQNYTLENITISDAKINIKYNKSNTPNFLVFKKTERNKSAVEIEKIILLKTDLYVKKEIPILEMQWYLNRSIISIDNNNYMLHSNGFSKKLIVGSTNYLNNKNFNFLAETQIKKDTIQIFKSNLNIQSVLLNLTGNIINTELLDLKITGSQQEINQMIMQMPKKIKSICSPFFTKGKITFKSSLKGLMNQENNPLFEMEYQIEGGRFKLVSNPQFELTEINFSGNLSNGKERNFNSTKIIASGFNAKTKNGNIDGKFKIENINHLFLDAEFQSSWDLKTLNLIFAKSPFQKMQGKLFNSTKYNGNIIFNAGFKDLFLIANHKSDIKLTNVSCNYKNSHLKYNFQNIDCKINKNNIKFESCLGTISETDFVFTGKTTNLIAYTLGLKDKIYVDGNITSTYSNLNELLTLGEIDNGTENANTSIMPNWLEANCNINITNLSYNNFVASNVTGDLKYRDNEMKSKNLEAKSLNGDIFGEFVLNEPKKKHLSLTSNISLKKINIRNSFDAFNNYGQTFISKEQLKGEGSATINIESHWNPNFILDEKKLKIKSHLIIEKGELIDFKPLEKLSAYISLDELKHVKFSTLENTIDVANEIITIPTMEIKSSALSVMLSGTHTFNQKIDYEITLLLSEIISSSFRKKNTKITSFSEKKQDGKIFNTIYFKMTGDTDDPKISLNKIRFMEDLNKTIKKEKTILSDILKEDVLQKKEKKKKEAGKEIEIEWEPNF